MHEKIMSKNTLQYSIIPVISIIFLLCWTTGCITLAGSEYPVDPVLKNTTIEVTDTSGNTVILSHPAQRIISTSTCAVELLVLLGAEDRIVGVTDNQLLVDTIVNGHLHNAIPFGGYATPSIEKIAEINPDMIIFYSGSSQPGNIDQIRNMGIPVIYVDSCWPSKINNDTLMLAKMTGMEKNATRFMEFNNKYLNLIESRLSSENFTRPRVYIESHAAYSAQGDETSANEMITILHGDNIARNLSGSLIVSNEWVVSNNPDIIVKSIAEWHPDLTKSYYEILTRPGFANISAVREQRIYVFNGPLTSRPRYIITLLYLAKQFYPDQFSDIDPAEVQHEYATLFLPGSDEIENRDFTRYYPPLSTGDRNQIKNSMP